MAAHEFVWISCSGLARFIDRWPVTSVDADISQDVYYLDNSSLSGGVFTIVILNICTVAGDKFEKLQSIVTFRNIFLLVT